MDIPDEPSLIDTLLVYMHDTKLPQDKFLADVIGSKFVKNTIIKDKLYKSSFTTPYFIVCAPMRRNMRS